MMSEPNIDDIKKLIKQMAEEPKDSHEENATYEKLIDKIDKFNRSEDPTEPATKTQYALDLLFYMMKTLKFWSKKEMEIVKRFVEEYPELTDSKRNGQTPLHLAICKGNTDLIEHFLSSPSVSEQKNGNQMSGDQNNEEQKKIRTGKNPFLVQATGDICKETVLMAEIPLSVAALTFRTGTVKVLLDRGAPIDGTNNLGDNVCHSLIRYASLYPEKVNRVRDMFVFLETEIKAKDDKRKANAKNNERKAKDEDIKKGSKVKENMCTALNKCCPTFFGDKNKNNKEDKTKNNEGGKHGEAKDKDIKEENEIKDDMCTAFNKRCPIFFGDKNKNIKEDKTKNNESDNDGKANDKDMKKEANDSKDYDKVNWHNIWKMTNNDDLTPLQLAARCGQHELFKYIMDSEIYCSKDTEEGLFDIKNYDIQEIDTISWREENGELKVVPRPEKQSVLKILLELDSSEAFQFILIPPVYQVIYNKWAYYIKLFWAVWIFFLLFTGMLIWYCIERAQQEFNSPSGFDISEAPIFKSKITTQPFLTAFSVITTVVALILLCLEIYRCYLGRLEYKLISFTNPYSHGCFRVTLVLISVLLIIDLLAATLSSLYENHCLLVAVILVCFCNIFFIRVIEKFSFSTALITKVIVRDMVPFFVILAIESIAFSTAMFMAIQGSEVIDDINYSHYGRVLFSMATLMVGLGDTANFYDTRNAGLTIAIFIAFVIFTTLLMINSLIAMISKTCTELFENVRNVNALHLHWSLQILSMIQFFESILPERLFCNVGTIDKDDQRRYLLEVRSNKDLQPIVVAEPSKVNELTETDAGTCQRHVSMTPVGSSMDHPFREPRCMDLYLMTDKYHTMERTVKLSH